MVILLEKLMLALKAMKDWVERELKKISGNVDATKNSLSTVENNLSTVQSDLNTVEDILTNLKMDKHDPAGTGSFSLNRRSGTTIGINSVAMGADCTASGDNSHAEGHDTTASGNYSHAEGSSTAASGNYSHAEGHDTAASGWYSHAEGHDTAASGWYSHAEGNGTTASSDYQHVQGKYNIEDPNDKYAHIVGNGTTKAEPSNAHTLDWNGLGWFAGGLKVGGTSQDDTTAKEVATKDYVDNSIADIPDGIYVHNEEPVDAEDGTLWLDTDEEAAVSGGANIDVTAAVGQTIVVEEVDASGKPTKWKAADYQPRTHWSETVEILPEITVEIDSESGMGLLPNFIAEYLGKYTIVYNGSEYICLNMEYGDQMFMGNIGMLGEDFEDFPTTNEPFALIHGYLGDDSEGNGIYSWAIVPFDGSETVTLSIRGETVTQIPTKYISPQCCVIDVPGVVNTTPIINIDTTELANAILNDLPIYMNIQYDLDEEGSFGVVRAIGTPQYVLNHHGGEVQFLSMKQYVQYFVMMDKMSEMTMELKTHITTSDGEELISVGINPLVDQDQ